MATNRVWNDPASGKKEFTEYHTVVAWGRLGEIAGRYLKKGGLVMIEGRLQTRNWVGQDNIKRYTTEIVAEGLQLGPRTEGRTNTTDIADIKRPAEDNIPIIDADEPTNARLEEDEMKIKEEDLPF